MSKLRSADVPEWMEESFKKAEKLVLDFFKEREEYPEKGSIEVGGTRFMMIQARALAVYVRKSLQDILGLEGTNRILYRLGKELGKADARTFHTKFGLEDPIDRLSVGPVYFAHSGWAFVHLLEPCNPTPDDDYLLYYNHPHSFEAVSVLDENIQVHGTVCFINAGYSAGWCQESFRIPLDARELTCIANGEEDCKFIMTVSSKLEYVVDNWYSLTRLGREITLEALLSGLPGYK